MRLGVSERAMHRKIKSKEHQSLIGLNIILLDKREEDEKKNDRKKITGC